MISSVLGGVVALSLCKILLLPYYLLTYLLIKINIARLLYRAYFYREVPTIVLVYYHNLENVRCYIDYCICYALVL